eukprot:11157751-Alexandrium_andersonii.AAC.1
MSGCPEVQKLRGCEHSTLKLSGLEASQLLTMQFEKTALQSAGGHWGSLDIPGELWRALALESSGGLWRDLDGSGA